MANLKTIRKRIGSVKNTQKITRAMKMIAASRLRRAQQAIVAARPYARSLERVIAEVAARAGRQAHPLLEERDIKRVELVLLTSDLGKAGGFNTNICRATEAFLFDHRNDYEQTGLVIIGRKGREYFKRRRGHIVRTYDAPTSATANDNALEMTRGLLKSYADKKLDAVFLIYNQFKSAISQEVQVAPLLPIVPKELPAGATPSDYIYEPSKKDVLDHILPRFIEVEIVRSMLESVASEFGARMSAMDSATNNAGDMIDRLTLLYNRARQAAITKELLEIISGAESLTG